MNIDLVGCEGISPSFLVTVLVGTIQLASS